MNLTTKIHIKTEFEVNLENNQPDVVYTRMMGYLSALLDFGVISVKEWNTAIGDVIAWKKGFVE